MSSTLALAQDPLAAGRQLYAEKCAACHGDDGLGSSHAPELSRARRLRGRSAADIREIIRTGTTSGMPAFTLPAAQLDALAAYVRSMNTTASEAAAVGDAEAGKRFFAGAGGCPSCHMVAGRGKAVGPDLSNIGRELSANELRQALGNPSARIRSGYTVVRVKLRDGRSIRGFARARSNFDLVLQDFDGRLRPIAEREIAGIDEEKQSFMPPLQAGAEQTANLIAYLSSLKGTPTGTAVVPQPQSPGAISFERIVQARPGDWLSYDGKLTGNRYSELREIGTANVNRLVLKWTSPVPQFGLEVTPLVADGIMYVAGPNQAYALDARTGRQIWTYSRPRTPGLVGDASLGTNRGVALLGDNIYMVTDNAHLIALNRTTGSLVWDQRMPDEPQHYGSTVAPLVVKDMVVAGVSGADWGIRGFIAAYKADSGERLWRHWTIPAKGEPGYETWQGEDPKYGGGGTWLTGSYDIETDTIFWGTATPWPVSDDRLRKGDNLYTDSTIAVDPATGKLKWHYQYTPHDLHAWDATEPHVLVNAEYHGRPRKLLLHADRNGFFYVFDRTNGELLLARNFVEVTWASGIGPDGRPQLTPVPPGKRFCPTDDPANWDSAVYSPVTRFYYVMALEQCATVGMRGNWTSVEHGYKVVRALNIETGKVVWERPQIGTTAHKHWAGLLGTAGGVLFFGDPNGDFVAADEKNGNTLWHYATNEVIKASPMSYTVDGKQYVAIAAGSNIMSFGLP